MREKLLNLKESIAVKPAEISISLFVQICISFFFSGPPNRLEKALIFTRKLKNGFRI